MIYNREPFGEGYERFKTDQKQRVVLTKNMRALLYNLLKSVKFNEGHTSVIFDKETQEFMDSFVFEDVVDCHTRLNLPDGYGEGVKERSRGYVIKKTWRLWRDGKRNNETCR